MAHNARLPVAKKLRIVEQLWDEIHDSDEQLIVKTWHKDEARRRSAELDANPNIALTREELWNIGESAGKGRRSHHLAADDG